MIILDVILFYLYFHVCMYLCRYIFIYVCKYIYIYIYIYTPYFITTQYVLQCSLLYKTTLAAKPKWSYTPGGLIRQVELVKQNLSCFNATVVSCFCDVDV